MTYTKDKFKNRFRTILQSTGLFSPVRFLYYLPGTIVGFLRYHFLKKKKFVLILSTMRSGSTLFKALLSNAPDIEQIPEAFFQIQNNKYYTYNRFSQLSSNEIVILKEPSHYPTFQSYPQFPNVEFKSLTLVRNPLDTVISLRKMNKELGINMTDEELLNYWLTTTENLLKLKDRENNMTVVYEDLVTRPKQITKAVFQFIGSAQQDGVDSYSKPKKYEWEWKKDDGGEIIKSLKVQNIKKDYSNEGQLIELISTNKKILDIMKKFNIPNIWKETTQA